MWSSFCWFAKQKILSSTIGSQALRQPPFSSRNSLMPISEGSLPKPERFSSGYCPAGAEPS